MDIKLRDAGFEAPEYSFPVIGDGFILFLVVVNQKIRSDDPVLPERRPDVRVESKRHD